MSDAVRTSMGAAKPKTLYLSFDDKLLERLCYDRVYYADPASFNDPLDCLPVVVADLPRSELEGLLAQMVVNRSAKEIDAAMKKVWLRGHKAIARRNALTESEARLVAASRSRSPRQWATTRFPNRPLRSGTRLWPRVGVEYIGATRVVETVDHTEFRRHRAERVNVIRAVKSEREWASGSTTPRHQPPVARRRAAHATPAPPAARRPSIRQRSAA